MIHEFSLNQFELISRQEMGILFPEASEALTEIEKIEHFETWFNGFSANHLAISNAGELWNFYSYCDYRYHGDEDWLDLHPDNGRRWDGKQWVDEKISFPEP
jgi:hypothetical protein